MTTADPQTLHMLPADDWRLAQERGRVEPASLAAEGFVHCTNGRDELAATGNRHYAADPRPFLALTVDLAHLDVPWRYDDAAQRFPHVYGPIPLAAVVGLAAMPRSVDGRFLSIAEVSVNAIAPLLDRLEAAGAQLASTRDAVERGAPWPVGAVAKGSGEAEWGPTEVLAHVSEMLQFWLGEMERVVAGSDGHGGGAPARFGRGPDDTIRGLTVIRDATLPPRELFDRIAGTLERYRRRLPNLSEDQIARVGVHPTRGELSVPQLLEALVVSHLEGHAEQLKATLPR